MNTEKPRPRTECSTCHRFWTRKDPPRQAAKDKSTGVYDGDYIDRFKPKYSPVRQPDGGFPTQYFHVDCLQDFETEAGRLILYQPTHIFDVDRGKVDGPPTIVLDDFRDGPDPPVPLHLRLDKKRPKSAKKEQTAISGR